MMTYLSQYIVVYSSIVESIGNVCDYYQVEECSTELEFSSSYIHHTDNKSALKYEVPSSSSWSRNKVFTGLVHKEISWSFESKF